MNCLLIYFFQSSHMQSEIFFDFKNIVVGLFVDLFESL